MDSGSIDRLGEGKPPLAGMPAAHDIREVSVGATGEPADERVLKASFHTMDRTPAVESDERLFGTGPVSSTFFGFFDFRVHGWVDVTINFPAGQVNSFSQVSASLTELNVPDGIPFIGNASMLVYNVAPHPSSDRRVITRCFIGWETDLLVRLNLIVAN